MDYAISRLCEAARDPVRVHMSFEDVAVTGHFQMGSRRSSVCGTTQRRCSSTKEGTKLKRSFTAQLAYS